LVLTDLDTTVIGGVSTQEIAHEDVKFIFNELWEENLVEASRASRYDGVNSWWEYSFAPVVQPTQRLANRIVSKPVKTQRTVASNVLAGVDGKIVSYVENRLLRRQPPTLKSVQGRLKGVKITTDQIKTTLLKKGYRVTRKNGLKPSLSVIGR
jgi:hypothetical protein